MNVNDRENEFSANHPVAPAPSTGSPDKLFDCIFIVNVWDLLNGP